MLLEQIGVHFIKVGFILVKGQVIKTEHFLVLYGTDDGVEVLYTFDLRASLIMNEALLVFVLIHIGGFTC
ncbi:MAG: hypothetical protein DRJ29_14925 [Bacteroidetes bacterium]|nr:MAG: hypothetical protein DRJ29_14925 [Bacteroidota bacterium]